MSTAKTYFKTNTIITVVILFGIFAYIKFRQPPAELHQARGGTRLNPPVELARFQLEDTKGKPFDKSSLEGRWSIISFGYTQCADVCPKTLGYFRDELNKMDQDTRDKTQFIFVSVDPANDTPQLLEKYVAAYHPGIQGVTGSVEQIKQFTTQFFNANATSPPGTAANTTDLIAMTHATKYYLVDPQGNWTAVYTPPVAEGSLAADMNRITKSNTVF